MLPGYALYRTISALIGQTGPITESFNVILPPEAAALYGTAPSRALSVPIHLGPNSYTIATDHAVSDSERSHLRDAQRRLEAAYAALGSSD